MRPSACSLFVALAVVLGGCATPTEPTPPFAVWHLQQLNGSSLPVAITTGASAVQLIADTLDLRAKLRGDDRAGSLVFVTRDAAGVLTRTSVLVGYTISNGRISINFNCLYNQVCFAIYAPLTAVIDGDQLFFQGSGGRESRLYRFAE